MALSEYLDEIVLASQSPARLEILRNEGLKVTAIPTNSNEETTLTEPDKVVTLLANRKLNAYMKSSSYIKDTACIACDTLISFNGLLIGKAHSEDEAYRQISMFSNNTHQVYTGYCLNIDGKTFSGFDKADVSFRKIEKDELEKYIENGEWKGAAGSYHIQGQAATFISSITGDINTVIGLPLSVVFGIIKSLRK